MSRRKATYDIVKSARLRANTVDNPVLNENDVRIALLQTSADNGQLGETAGTSDRPIEDLHVTLLRTKTIEPQNSTHINLASSIVPTTNGALSFGITGTIPNLYTNTFSVAGSGHTVSVEGDDLRVTTDGTVRARIGKEGSLSIGNSEVVEDTTTLEGDVLVDAVTTGQRNTMDSTINAFYIAHDRVLYYRKLAYTHHPSPSVQWYLKRAVIRSEDFINFNDFIGVQAYLEHDVDFFLPNYFSGVLFNDFSEFEVMSFSAMVDYEVYDNDNLPVRTHAQPVEFSTEPDHDIAATYSDFDCLGYSFTSSPNNMRILFRQLGNIRCKYRFVAFVTFRIF